MQESDFDVFAKGSFKSIEKEDIGNEMERIGFNLRFGSKLEISCKKVK